MKTEQGIISKMEIPEGYNIRVGKAAWYCLCFFLNIVVTAFALGSEGLTVSLVLMTISILSIVLAGHYFHAFRDRIRWMVMASALVACSFALIMLLRILMEMRWN